MLEAELAPHYQRRPVRKTIEKMERLERWRRAVLAKAPGDDPVVTVHRSFPQLFSALELERTGHIKADRKRFRNSVALLLDYATEIGMFAGWEEAPRKSNGEGTGILVQLRRDSSVGGAHLPRKRRIRRFSSYTKSAPPLREKCSSLEPGRGRRPLSGRSSSGENGRRARTGARRGGPPATAAAIQALKGTEESAAELLRRLPWLADVEPVALLRAAAVRYGRDPSAGWNLERRDTEARHLRLSRRAQAQVEAAYEQLELYGGRGAGAAAILELAAGGWRQYPLDSRTGELLAPRTAGALAKPLRQRARFARLCRRADVARCELHHHELEACWCPG